ncbi:MAG: methyltransferase domain-containing protein [Promethearchaeia archaeon]
MNNNNKSLSVKSKLISVLWKIFNKVPNLRNNLYRFYAWKIFEYVPRLKDLIYKAYDKYWYFELFIDNRQISLEKFQKKKYSININRIQFTIKKDKLVERKVINFNQNWDSPDNLIEIENTNEYILIENHFIKKKNWQDIEAYSEIIKKFSDNMRLNGCSNIQEFSHLLDSLDNLYQNYYNSKQYDFNQEIKVGIGRNGNYILLEGLLYLSFLKILKLNEINITVLTRHPNWINFSKEFFKFQYVHGAIYQPLIHPDLSLKSSYSDVRYNIIEKNLKIRAGTLLDIGANLGYFCHKFEDVGFDCYAVEIRPSNVHFMKKLRDIEGKKFKIINQSIFELKRTKFDIILSLNIFHHFLREKKLYLQLVEFLNKLKIKYMYFQPHNQNEKVMQNAYINFNNQQFVDFILNNSCLNKSKLLSENIEGTGRPLYLLSN